jgi:ABC-type glycerol-3-phosphate transport system substrate-binding protein
MRKSATLAILGCSLLVLGACKQETVVPADDAATTTIVPVPGPTQTEVVTVPVPGPTSTQTNVVVVPGPTVTETAAPPPGEKSPQ